jgi:glycerol-3-phosphate dehydrogenase
MLHGGIRYLEQLDFSLVWEALHEKNYWLKLAPHLCYESAFYMPVYKTSKYNKAFLKMGLLTYDILSSFNNSPHRIISKEETLKTLPQLNSSELTGSGIYYDAIVDDTRLVIENILSGLESSKSKALNYTELISYEKESDVYKTTIRDTLTGEITVYFCKNIIFSLGPMTDIVLKKLIPSWNNCLVPSRGIHLWFKKDDFPISKPVVVQTKDNRVLFVIPQKDHVYIGTTEKISFKDIESPVPQEDEIDYLLGTLSLYFNDRYLSKSKITSSVCGIRPLYKGANTDLTSSSNVSRHHKVIKPDQNIYVIVGGKLTTFRTMAQDVVSQIINRENGVYNSSLTLKELKPRGVYPFNINQVDQNLLKHIREKEMVRNDEDLLLRRLSLIENSELYNKIKKSLS